MKLILISMAVLASVSLVHAADSDCTANAVVPAQSVSGSCVAGKCSSAVGALDFSAGGNCASGQTFSAAAKFPGGSLVGRCDGDQFLGVATGLYLKFSGTCSAGGAFTGTSYVRFQYASGTCDENGAFNAVIKSTSIPVEGACP